MYLIEDVALKLVHILKLPFECFLIEVNVFRKKRKIARMFLHCQKSSVSDYLKELSKVIDRPFIWL